MKRALLVCALLAACHDLPPEILPPPFGPLPENIGQTHLFFPSGMAQAPSGALIVANGNFNHAYDSGSVVSLKRAFVAGFFNGSHTGDVPLDGDEPAVLIGNYAGPLTLNDSGTIGYTGSRDTGVLNAVAINADGTLGCAPGAGSGTDCRPGLVNLKTALISGTTNTANIDGPFSIVRGNFIPQGTTTARDVWYVNSVVPHIDAVSSGIIATSSSVAALDINDPSQVLFTLLASGPLPTQGNGWSPGMMVFDSVRRRLFMMGCYSRFAGTGAGEPGTAKCNNNTSNLLRVIDVDAQAAGDTQFFELYTDVLSIETEQIMLADPDPVTGASTSLYATMRNPDSLVQIALPLDYSQPPRVRRVVPMPITPGNMLRIARPGNSDLIAVVSERSGAIAFYDTGRQTVVSQVQGMGDSPFDVQQVTCPPEAAGSACLAVTVFGECRIAFVQVPLDTPWNATFNGRGGGCLQ
jgi:hypothetical protein